MQENTGRIHDIAETTLEEGSSNLLEHLPDIASLLRDTPIAGPAQILADGFIGAIAPGIFGAALSYRQKRTERNIRQVIKELADKQNIINDRLDKLEEHDRKRVAGIYRDAMLDNVVDENQETKVCHNINAYINVMDLHNSQEDFVLTFFKNLGHLTELDIQVLRIYSVDNRISENPRSAHDVVTEAGIDDQQYRAIQEKLARLGLLSSKNEEKRDKNLELVQDVLSRLVKQSSARNPRTIQVPHFANINRRDSYSITRLGLQYVNLLNPPKQADTVE